MGGPFQGGVENVHGLPSGAERWTVRLGWPGGAPYDELAFEKLTFGCMTAFGNGGEDLRGRDATESDGVASD